MTPDKFKQVALSNADVKQNIESNPSRRQELLRCIDVLAEDNEAAHDYDVCSAVCKAHDAIIDGIKIFVSYKLDARSAPAKVLSPFKHFHGGRIKIDNEWPFVAETSIRTGAEWPPSIFRTLAQTHWFLQILPERSADRYWVSFEAGHFHRGMQQRVDRLICIHHPSVDLAGPLRTFKSVKGDAPAVLEFLRELLCNENAIPGMPPITGTLDDQTLRPYAESIFDELNRGGTITRQYLVKYIDLDLEAQGAPSTVGELLECVIVASSGADQLFDYLSSDATGAIFKDLASQLDRFGDANGVWLEQLVQALKAVYSRARPEEIFAEFRAANGTYYRPHLHAIRRRETDGTIESVHLAFHEALAAPVARAPVELDALQTAFQLAYRLRWELLEEYGRPRNRNDLAAVMRVLQRIEIESEQRGLYRRSILPVANYQHGALVSAFAPDQRDEIIRMYEAYKDIRSPGTNDGLLDKACESGDVAIARDALEQMRTINRRFVELAADRLAEVSKREW